MPDVLQVLAEELAALRRRVEVLEAQEDATVLSYLSVGAGSTYFGVAATGKITATGPVVLGRTSATIASDAIAATSSYMTLETEGGAATDDLGSISGGVLGMLLILQTVNTAHDVTVKHAAAGGNIYLSGRVDFTLTGTRDRLVLMSNGSEWLEIGRGDNAA